MNREETDAEFLERIKSRASQLGENPITFTPDSSGFLYRRSDNNQSSQSNNSEDFDYTDSYRETNMSVRASRKF